MKPVSAWPAAADWLSGRLPPGSTPTAAGYLASRRQGPRSTSTEPQGASAGGDATSAYQRLFRAKVAETLKLTREEGEATHPASPWKYKLVGAVQDLCRDPDDALRLWLQHGAPMGIRRDKSEC